MHYLTQKKIQAEFMNTKDSYSNILQSHINHFSFILQHYIKIISLFNQIKENQQSCVYNGLLEEIEICYRRISLLEIIQINDKYKAMLKHEKTKLFDCKYFLLHAKRERDYMVIYNYGRFIQSLKKSRNFINYQVKSLKKELYQIYN